MSSSRLRFFCPPSCEACAACRAACALSTAPSAPAHCSLATRAYPAAHRWVGDTAVGLYLVGQPERESRPNAPFGALARLVEALWTTWAHPGGALLVELTWEAQGDSPEPYSVFVHVEDAQGKTVAQHDGEPADGTRPTTGWPGSSRRGTTQATGRPFQRSGEEGGPDVAPCRSRATPEVSFPMFARRRETSISPSILRIDSASRMVSRWMFGLNTVSSLLIRAIKLSPSPLSSKRRISLRSMRATATPRRRRGGRSSRGAALQQCRRVHHSGGGRRG